MFYTIYCTCITQNILYMYYTVYSTYIIHYIIYNILNILYYSELSEVKLEGTAESGFPAKEAIVQTMKKEETKQDETVKA